MKITDVKSIKVNFVLSCVFHPSITRSQLETIKSSDCIGRFWNDISIICLHLAEIALKGISLILP